MRTQIEPPHDEQTHRTRTNGYSNNDIGAHEDAETGIPSNSTDIMTGWLTTDNGEQGANMGAGSSTDGPMGKETGSLTAGVQFTRLHTSSSTNRYEEELAELEEIIKEGYKSVANMGPDERMDASQFARFQNAVDRKEMLINEKIRNEFKAFVSEYRKQGNEHKEQDDEQQVPLS